MMVYLYLGHLIGDMLLQTRHMVKTKGKAFDGIILHSIVVTFITALVYMCPNPRFWMVYIIVFIGHTIIDEIKCKLDLYNKSPKLVAIDQVVHFIFLLLLVLAVRQEESSHDGFYTIPYWQNQYIFSKPYFHWMHTPIAVKASIIISGLIIAIQFTGNLLQKIVQKHADQCSRELLAAPASNIAGICERTLVYIFAIGGYIPAIALLLTARAVMDHSLLNNHKEIKTEYAILRTLTSFCWAAVTGYIVRIIIFS